jgi:hypothetical protein
VHKFVRCARFPPKLLRGHSSWSSSCSSWCSLWKYSVALEVHRVPAWPRSRQATRCEERTDSIILIIDIRFSECMRRAYCANGTSSCVCICARSSLCMLVIVRSHKFSPDPGSFAQRANEGAGMDGRLVRMSKSLSWLLRHGAVEAGVTMDPAGFVPWSEIKALKQFRDFSMDDLLHGKCIARAARV